jgi:protoheme IX farnesyltransferase
MRDVGNARGHDRAFRPRPPSALESACPEPQETTAQPMPSLRTLALASATLTFTLVVIGAIVRVTGSGLGCPDWPLCYGGALPPLSDEKAWIEWIHRAVAVVVGLFVLALAFVAVRHHRDRPGLVALSLGALALTGFQAWLGRETVRLGNSGESVTAHLAAAMLLLGLLTLIAVRARYPARFPSPGASQRFTLLAAFAALSVFALLLFGSHVTATGSALVFPDWPLFEGSLLPHFSDDPQLASLQQAHFLHRLVALIVGLIVLGTAWAAWRARADSDWLLPTVRPTAFALAATAAALYAVQVVVGALQIFTSLAPWVVALHLSLGALIWTLLVATSVYAYCEARAAGLREAPPLSPREPTTAADAGLRDRLGAYVALTKPRIIELLLVTTVPAMILAARGIPRLDLVAWTLIGGSLAAGSANAINQYLERDIDGLMSRTRRRPLPAHTVDPENALLFGLALGVVAFAELALLVNLLSAFLALLAIAFYVVVYTILLKRSTPQNIVIGGAAGSLPPVIGWTAVTGDITLPALILFAIVFYWTPPHFWALSLRLARDYRAAGVPMLPVVRGVPETTRQIALYSVLLVALTLIFFAVAGMGLLYLAGALLLGGVFLAQSFAMWREGTERRAVALYRYSITYLTALFALMAVDVLLPLRLLGT